jgi:hypothetical protein
MRNSPTSTRVDRGEPNRVFARAPKICDEVLRARGAPVSDVTIFPKEIACESPHTREDTGVDINTFLQNVLDTRERKQMATHMVREPDDANPGPMA